jgi:hypothetical protein
MKSWMQVSRSHMHPDFGKNYDPTKEEYEIH